MMPGAYQIDYWVIISTPGGSIEGFSGVLGRFEPFSAVSAPKIVEITKFLYFSDKPNVALETEEKLSKGVLLSEFP